MSIISSAWRAHTHVATIMATVPCLARAALRHRATPSLCLLPTLSRGFASTYHAYPLPPKPPTRPRNGDMAKATMSQPDPLPRVHETRPPRSQRQQQQSPQQSSQPSPSTPPSQLQTAAPSASPEPQADAQKPRPAPRTRPKLRARRAAMKLTPAAVEQLRTLLDQPDPKLIKVGVRNRGCSGLTYHLEYVDKAEAFDEVVEQDGVKVLVDSKALFSIIGSEMDWAEDKLNQRFVFRNPNISMFGKPAHFLPLPGPRITPCAVLTLALFRGGVRLRRVVYGIEKNCKSWYVARWPGDSCSTYSGVFPRRIS